MQARHRRKSLEGREVEQGWPLDQSVDEDFVPLRIDGRYAGVMALEVQIRRGHDPAQILERCERDTLAAVDRDAPWLLEGRALAERTGQCSRDLGRVDGDGVSVWCLPRDLDEASASERLCSERACGSGEKSSTGNRRVRHRLPSRARVLCRSP